MPKAQLEEVKYQVPVTSGTRVLHSMITSLSWTHSSIDGYMVTVVITRLVAVGTLGLKKWKCDPKETIRVMPSAQIHDTSNSEHEVEMYLER